MKVYKLRETGYRKHFLTGKISKNHLSSITHGYFKTEERANEVAELIRKKRGDGYVRKCHITGHERSYPKYHITPIEVKE